MKLLFIDLETTGTNYTEHGIHQMSCIIRIDGKDVASLDFKVRPHRDCQIDDEALAVGGVTREQIMNYPLPETVYRSMVATMGKYVSKYDARDKFHIVGYNIAAFDVPFLRRWFERCGDKYYGSWFWSAPLDVMVLAANHLKEKRPSMPDFKLATVATHLGIVPDPARLHEAMYDTILAKQIYDFITGERSIGCLPSPSNSIPSSQFKRRYASVEELAALVDNAASVTDIANLYYINAELVESNAELKRKFSAKKDFFYSSVRRTT